MPAKYASFQIRNTTDVPIRLSMRDRDGDLLNVGTLKPGQVSFQVAPIDTSWQVQHSNPEPLKKMDLAVQARQAVIPTESSKLDHAGTKPGPKFWGTPANSNPADYKAFLKIETGSHTSRINQLLVTPDGKSLITSGEDKTIRIWDVETRTQTGVLLGQIGTGEEGKIQAISMSRDGRYIVALAWMYPDGSHDPHKRETDVRVYELATGNLQARFRYPGTLQDLDFSPDPEGSYLVIVGNPRDRVRRGHVMVYRKEDILRRSDKAPAPLASQALFDYDALVPSYVRCIPDNQQKPEGFRIAVATWYYPESNGWLLWYAFTPMNDMAELKNLAKCDLQVRPESLAVSHEFAVVTGDLATVEYSDEKNTIFCYDHQGQLQTSVLSDARPAGPVFSRNGTQLIVGQWSIGSSAQVKVYDVAFGQVQLKSTYYGHDSEVLAVTLLPDGTAVSAGGDQNEIHFWNTAYIEGERMGAIKGMGRAVHAVGIKESENEISQIGFGNRSYVRQQDGSIVLQRAFDFRSWSVTSLPFEESRTFQRAQPQAGELRLEWIEEGTTPNLWLLSPGPQDMPWLGGQQPLTGTPDPEKDGSWLWYKATTFGFTENLTIITGDHEGKVRAAPRGADGSYAWLPWRLLVGHEARVLDHAASGKWLVTAGADQIIRLWYLEDVEQDGMTDLEPALNLFVGANDEWVIWSRSGYYMASQKGDRYLGYHVNRDADKEALFFPSDRFHNVFFRPDIIQEILFYGSEERVFAKAAESKVSIQPVNVAEILPPIVELNENGVRTWEDKKDGFVEFTLTVDSHGKPIKRFCVLRNGRLASVIPVEESAAPFGKVTIPPIPLLPGDNRFKIFAENQDAQSHAIKSNPIEQTISGKGRFEDEAVVKNGMLYVLAIGVSKGIKLRKPGDEKGPYELRFADKDAWAVLDTFASNQAFEGVERTLLVNDQATKENILNALDEIGRKINEKFEERIAKGQEARDVLLVYLSGHGVYRILDQQLYFWNYDYDDENPGGTGLAFMDLGEKITSLPAEVILMTDACHSGMAGTDVIKGFDPDKNGIDPNELAKRIYGINESDIYIFNAARRSESALEGMSVEHGYFTKAILDTLAESLDPGVTAIGLIDQVQWRVREYKGNAQNPVCRMYGDLLPLTVYKK